MIFNSLEYGLFLTVVVAVFFVLPRRHRNPWLLTTSFVFYMSWSVPFVALILYTTTIDFFVARRMEAAGSPVQRRNWLLLSLVTNFGVLFLFKYYNFFVSNWEVLRGWIRAAPNPPLLNVILPLGISFYTFEAVSYVFDVYRGKYSAERSYPRLLLFIMFFPKLIAGPIERAAHLIPQFDQPVAFEYERVRNGLVQILWGVFKKVVIADRLAVYVNAVYNNADHHVGSSMLLATFFFSFQIYCDFSAYSDIALGSARILGIDLLRNFRRPYLASSFTDFWSRWHISLSTWFRDYLYIPLGGNRRGYWRTNLNVFVVFLVSGIWHGANWTFFWWGIYHGIFILIQSLWGRFGDPVRERVPSLPGVKVGATFAAVCLSWVLFRANSITDAVHIYGQIFGNFDLGGLFVGANLRHIVYGFAGIAALVLGEMISERGAYGRIWLPQMKPVRWATYAGLVLAILALGVADGGEFIYFQF